MDYVTDGALNQQRPRCRWLPAERTFHRGESDETALDACTAPRGTGAIGARGPATATQPPTRKLKHASGPIVALAMDGPRVVYSTQGNGVFVWNIRSNAASRVRGHSSSDNPLVQEVAIAGTRVAWITRSAAGNTEETFENLYTASSSGAGTKARARLPDPRVRTGRRSALEGQLDHRAGGLRQAARRQPMEDKAEPWRPHLRNDRERPFERDQRKRRAASPIASGESRSFRGLADSGRVAVLRQDGSVGIYSSAGQLLRQITPSSANEIAMGGGRLVVLTKTKTLEVYDPGTGTLVHSWPIKTRACSICSSGTCRPTDESRSSRLIPATGAGTCASSI